MRIRRIFFLSILIVLFASVPAFASINFEVNGTPFKPNADYVLNNGVTYIESSLINTVMGADVDVTDQDVVITHNNDKLVLTIGHSNALLNNDNINLSATPYQSNGITMLPLRTVLDNMGAKIGWNEAESTVLIDYVETRNDMLADDLLVETSQLMNNLPSYDMDGTMKMQMMMSGIEEEGFPLEIAMETDLYAHYEMEPLTVYIKQKVKMGDIPGMPPEAADTEVESVLMEDKYYINMPGEGWIIMDLGPLGLDELMQSSLNQDPAEMLKQMQDFGMISNYGNDVTIDGQKYWVINVTIDQDKFNDEFENIMSQFPVPQDEFSDILSNINLAMDYSSLINTTTLMTDYIDMDMTMGMSMASPEENSSEVLDMTMKMNGRFNIKEAAKDFVLPDLSSAVELPLLTD